LDVQTVSIAAVIVALGVIAYSFLAKSPSGLLPVGKSLDNTIDGGKAWHDMQEFGFRSISDNSTHVSHAEVLDALSKISKKFDSEDGSINEEDDVTAAPFLDSSESEPTTNDITARKSKLQWS
ncbi:unnamed protein product, partial [Meganyctiphanes norvegica]